MHKSRLGRGEMPFSRRLQLQQRQNAPISQSLRVILAPPPGIRSVSHHNRIICTYLSMANLKLFFVCKHTHHDSYKATSRIFAHRLSLSGQNCGTLASREASARSIASTCLWPNLKATDNCLSWAKMSQCVEKGLNADARLKNCVKIQEKPTIMAAVRNDLQKTFTLC